MSWLERANCRGLGHDLFYSDSVNRARNVCQNCDVVHECLQASFVEEPIDQIWGIRGGLTPKERQRFRMINKIY